MSQRFGRLADRWRAGVLVFVFALSLPVAYAGPLGFAPLVALGGLLAPPAILNRVASAWLALVLLALVGWATISLLWSSAAAGPGGSDYAALESLTALKLGLLLMVGSALVLAADGLTPRTARLCMAVVALVVVVLTVTLFVEGLTGAGLYQAIRNGLDDPIRPDLAARNVAQTAYTIAVLFWPAALALVRFDRRAAVLAGAVGLLGAVAALMFGAFAPAAAIAVGLAAYALVSTSPRVGALLCAAGTFVGVCAAPFVLAGLRAPPGIPASWTARADIWRFASERVLERPWLGWGLDASRSFGPAVPLHPHDAALQMWLELGVVGAVLYALFWGVVFWFSGRAAEDDPPSGGIWAATAATYLTIGALSFGAWQEWWLALGAIGFAAALCVRRGWPPRDGASDALQPIG